MRETRALGARNPTFGGLRPPKVGGPPNPRGKKFVSRHAKIFENAVISSLMPNPIENVAKMDSWYLKKATKLCLRDVISERFWNYENQQVAQRWVPIALNVILAVKKV